ncbi:MAG: HAMP domain-containing protein [Verrucomicrobia bacterium]|nr:HAMP domain-containing protein [Verrucomicrobiota bacterium]
MQFLINLPIKRKLILVILLTSTAALLVASLAFFVFQILTVRHGFVRDLDALSDIIANQSNVAVGFNDKKTAREILTALKAKPYIVAASIEKNGEEFARFGSREGGLPVGLTNGYRFEGDYLLHARPIVLDAEQVGTLYLRSEYQKAYAELVRVHLGILVVVLAGAILLTLVLSTRVQRVISDPILHLADTARTVAENKDYSKRAAALGKDELGLFTEAFNQMLAQIQTQDTALQNARNQLEERVKALQHEIAERERAERQLEIAHRELLEASRRAGMAEVATGVLHNVGNVLNSVNVSSTLLRDAVRKSEVTTLHKLAALFREHTEDLPEFLSHDPRGRQVPQLVAELAEQLAQERNGVQAELDSLVKNVDHIKNIVAMQQSYASVAGFVERVEIDRLVEDALEINSAALERHGVKVVREFQTVPPVFLDKHKVLQVLVNLIQNAKYALGESGRADKQITLAIHLNSDRGVEITVRDNGIGIPAENLTRIFAHGFTTRKKGHGFGLHASALAARDMGGSLKAHSDGPSRGATFVLTLPLFTKDTRHELTS